MSRHFHNLPKCNFHPFGIQLSAKSEAIVDKVPVCGTIFILHRTMDRLRTMEFSVFHGNVRVKYARHEHNKSTFWFLYNNFGRPGTLGHDDADLLTEPEPHTK